MEGAATKRPRRFFITCWLNHLLNGPGCRRASSSTYFGRNIRVKRIILREREIRRQCPVPDVIDVDQSGLAGRGRKMTFVRVSKERIGHRGKRQNNHRTVAA